MSRPATGAPAWARSLAELVPVPSGAHERLVDRGEALGILGCDDAVLDDLERRGLPVIEGALFDYHDLVNVGLYSGSGQSVAELAQQTLLRFARATPEEWARPRRWSLRIEHRCLAGSPCAGEDWALTRPALGDARGRVEAWSVRRRVRTDGEAGCRAEVEIRARVVLQGQWRSVRSRAACEAHRELVEAVLSGRVRYQWMPRRLHQDPASAARLGITDCTIAGRALAGALSELGLEARTRRAHILGVVAVEHVWVEVRDEDGGWKALDPILAVLGRRTPHTNPEFEAFCMGSTCNRVLPWRRGPHVELAGHLDGAVARPARTTLVAELTP